MIPIPQLGRFDLVVRRQGEASVLLTLRGELDLEGARIIRERVVDLLDWGVPGIEVDAGELCFVDSAGFKALLDARRAAREAGVRFSMRSASERLTWVSEVTNRHELLESA